MTRLLRELGVDVINLRRLKEDLLQYYSRSSARAFHRFRSGVIYFAVGFGTILMANLYMPPSLQQELVVLLALILTAIGFVMAMIAQTHLIISRLVQFARRK